MNEEERKQWPRDQQAAFDRLIYTLCGQFEAYAPNFHRLTAREAAELFHTQVGKGTEQNANVWDGEDAPHICKINENTG